MAITGQTLERFKSALKKDYKSNKKSKRKKYLLNLIKSKLKS